MTTVYTKIVGDLFHPGHVAFLKQAKELGHILVVHVVSDERASKAKRRPIMTQEERGIMVAACKYVDKVVFEGPIQLSTAFMDEQGYDLYAFACVSEDESRLKHQDCGDLPRSRIRELLYTPHISTTLLRERIAKTTLK